ERVVEERLAECGVLTHVGEDRPLGARRDDRLRDPLDPDERAAAVPAAVVADRLDRVDLVGAGVLAEAEEDHPVAVRHVGIIAWRAWRGRGRRAANAVNVHARMNLSPHPGWQV